MTTPQREAARVIVMDDADRILLLRYDENGGFWATPGGSLDLGEDHDTAARRELREELGVDDVEMGPQLAERSQVHHVGGRPAHQVERYYLARIDPAAVDPARATQPDGIGVRRWWTLDELRATDQTVYPVGLASLITDVLAHGVPQRPVVLAG
ncbi:NUDIX hydrolase [Actinacidiphila oryziradicis]|uniref:NUDIX domain-containing protein n=1 Tax=Actinacidiphila oryziradicis TaxID=2571141 RepID=A0A4U0RPH7_9ACTN|nr:NUDIX domain-containing protein [Actinacidiphila oryziradicis]TJZ97132.1 NUDIX domain-containing protein [Actinacidiphila oryziradicis]